MLPDSETLHKRVAAKLLAITQNRYKKLYERTPPFLREKEFAFGELSHILINFDDLEDYTPDHIIQICQGVSEGLNIIETRLIELKY
jgi:hypothetical protein